MRARRVPAAEVGGEPDEIRGVERGRRRSAGRSMRRAEKRSTRPAGTRARGCAPREDLGGCRRATRAGAPGERRSKRRRRRVSRRRGRVSSENGPTRKGYCGCGPCASMLRAPSTSPAPRRSQQHSVLVPFTFVGENEGSSVRMTSLLTKNNIVRPFRSSCEFSPPPLRPEPPCVSRDKSEARTPHRASTPPLDAQRRARPPRPRAVPGHRRTALLKTHRTRHHAV